ncbi:MAG: metal ABC transporter permease [Cytophagales bacterium]|nr:metal ABC transporter permease [Cytophagales bacterium]MDW8383548.1 metal ABC transporter permease [Flammeovirgaceae bacterium]
MVNAFWIIIAGSLVAASCALPGCFLLLRRQSLVGDAISHAILPGIAIAYLFFGRNPWVIWISATCFGLFSTILMDWIHYKTKLQADTAIGVVFTFFFAIGIILVSFFAGNVDIDQECVLYGEIAYIPLENKWLGVPVSIWRQLILLVFIIAAISIFYKQFLITTFDEEFAKLSGFQTTVWHYALMGIVSLATVVSFEAVGAILVISFLVVPAAIAFLLAHRLISMLIISVIVSIIISFAGYWLAIAFNASIAGAMAVVSGISFIVIWMYEKIKKIN